VALGAVATGLVAVGAVAIGLFAAGAVAIGLTAMGAVTAGLPVGSRATGRRGGAGVGSPDGRRDAVREFGPRRRWSATRKGLRR
jgi:hypothetical protein